MPEPSASENGGAFSSKLLCGPTLGVGMARHSRQNATLAAIARIGDAEQVADLAFAKVEDILQRAPH